MPSAKASPACFSARSYGDVAAAVVTWHHRVICTPAPVPPQRPARHDSGRPRLRLCGPKAGADGSLYAIRRPVETPVHEQAGGAIKDTLLLPSRLGKAVFGYLNFFSMIYGKEPLRSAGGPAPPSWIRTWARCGCTAA